VCHCCKWRKQLTFKGPQTRRCPTSGYIRKEAACRAEGIADPDSHRLKVPDLAPAGLVNVSSCTYRPDWARQSLLKFCPVSISLNAEDPSVARPLPVETNLSADKSAM